VERSEQTSDRQQSSFVQSLPSIAVPALTTNAFAFVIFGVISLSVILSLLLLSSRTGSAYDEIGRGGISGGDDHSRASSPAASTPAAVQAEREREIRQMLSARSERLERKGQPPLDIDAELARLLAAEQAPAAPDEGLLEEVRQLVMARNDRRVRQGLEPLDVDSEVARTIAELGP
jgi:hypothetical protein